jgi:CDP-glucose 4,6-dehydratase
LRDQCTLVEASLDDAAALSDLFDTHDVRKVFHLAAQTQVGNAYHDPLLTWESNIRGTYMLFEAIRGHNAATQVVVASSDKAYGAHEQLSYARTSRSSRCTHTTSRRPRPT